MPVPFRWLATIAFAALIIVLSITPGSAANGDSTFVWVIQVTPKGLQKVMHVACYGILGVLLAWSLQPISSRILRYVLVGCVSLALGIALELLQTLVPGRFATLSDILLNGIGAMLGILVAAAIVR